MASSHHLDDEDELTRDSNALVDLVHEDELDQAEAAARDLLERYPEVHNRYDRLGMVYEVRGVDRGARSSRCDLTATHPP